MCVTRLVSSSTLVDITAVVLRFSAAIDGGASPVHLFAWQAPSAPRAAEDGALSLPFGQSAGATLGKGYAYRARYLPRWRTSDW